MSLGITETADVVLTGGTLNVSGTASGTTISSGGLVVVFSGGLAIATTVSSGGGEVIVAGATTSNGVVLSSGSQYTTGRSSAR